MTREPVLAVKETKQTAEDCVCTCVSACCQLWPNGRKKAKSKGEVRV